MKQDVRRHNATNDFCQLNIIIGALQTNNDLTGGIQGRPREVCRTPCQRLSVKLNGEHDKVPRSIDKAAAASLMNPSADGAQQDNSRVQCMLPQDCIAMITLQLRWLRLQWLHLD